MSKLTPEELETLQQSDPAAFDLDVPVEAKDDTKPDDTKDAAKDDKPRDEQGRFKAADDAKTDDVKPEDAKADDKKDDEPAGMIPQARLDEVVAQRNEARRQAEELRARLAEAEAAAAKANTPDHDARISEINAAIEALDAKFDEGDVDFKEYQKQHAQLVADRTRAEIGAEQAKKAAEEAQKKAAEAQQTAEERWVEAQSAFFSAEGNAKYRDQPALLDAIKGAVGRQFANGVTDFAEVLAGAKKEVDTAFGIAKADPHAERNKSDATAASKASATPPAINGGVGNRGTEPGVVDLKNLKPGKFSSLPKTEQEKLLGEGAL